jgi:cytochrome c biogenesis protein CcdA
MEISTSAVLRLAAAHKANSSSLPILVWYLVGLVAVVGIAFLLSRKSKP